MGLPGLSRPAGDAAKQAERRRRPDVQKLQPIHWAVLAVAGGVLFSVGKLLKHIVRGGQIQQQDVEALPTHVLVNSKGVEVHISPVGAAIERLNVPDRSGRLTDIVLGFDKKTPYADGTNPYFGVVVGRCANRIANASFTIDGKQHKLTANDGQHALHGGERGWGMQVWDAEKTTHEGAPAVRLTYTSKDGEEGYPGTVKATVTYILTDGVAKQDKGYLRAIMTATTDKASPLNMAQHSYFNLAGHDAGTILGHRLTISADRYTPVDDSAIPTGELEPVKGTPFDFTMAQGIGSRIKQLPDAAYDHNYVLRSTASKADPKLKQAAVLQDPGSGRSLEIATSKPGLQFYSGNFLDGSSHGKGGFAYPKYAGVALESQAFPNSINQPQFPSVVLRPGETYHHEVAYTLKATK